MFFQKIICLFLIVSGWATLTYAGAVSGGGGGSLQGSPVELGMLREAAYDSKILIDSFLNGMSTRLALEDTGEEFSPHKNFRRFFVRGAILPELLDSVRIAIDEVNPCQDLDGNPVDGSINTGVPNGICLSLPRLHEKLGTSNFEVEIAALILHEISHLLGYNEMEAVQNQMKMLEAVRGQNSSMIRGWSAQSAQTLKSLDALSSFFSLNLRDGSKVSGYYLRDLALAHHQAIYQLAKPGLSLMNEIGMERLIQNTIQIQAATDYLCSLLSDDGNFGATQRYNDGFASQEVVTTDAYERRSSHNLATLDRFPLIKINISRLNSIEEAAQIIDQVSRPLTRMVAYPLEDKLKLRFKSL